MNLQQIIYGVVFDKTNLYHRIIRRAVIMGLIALSAELTIGLQGGGIDITYAPIIVAVLSGLDKGLREML